MTSQTHSYRVGTHRIRPPEATLAEVEPYMPTMGITRIADVTGLDSIGIPVVMVMRPNSRSVAVSQGKGFDLIAAKASGLMESVEGFHAENISKPLRIASLLDMKKEGLTVDTGRLPVMQNSPFHEHYPITWIESEDMYNAERKWLPYEMVHTNYTEPRATGDGCFPASSNGLASGNSMTEATNHAICEVIERDCLSLWSFFNARSRSKTAIDLSSIDSELCNETLKKLAEAQQETFIWNLTSDISVATFLCVIRDRNSFTPHIGIGSGTHLSREVALLRALHEAVQVRTTYIVGARDDLTPREFTPEGMQEKRNYCNWIIDQSTFESRYTDVIDLHTDSTSTDLDVLLKQLKRVGVDEVLRVDLQKPQFSIPVVRVVIPGLESPHDDDGYVAGERALRVQKENVS